MTQQSDNRRLQLDRLLDPVREDLEIEVKTWLNTSNGEDRANIAQALLALANHGGGFLILGFEEVNGGWVASTPHPRDLSQYNQDNINGIVERYADPVFHCTVESVRSRGDGLLYPIVKIPGGHSVPIRANRGGPNNKHVTKDTYYIRRPGPASAPPQSSEEWRALIRRCLLNDKDTLLTEIQQIISGRPAEPAQPLTESAEKKGRILNDWAQSSRERFDSLIREKGSDVLSANYDHGTWSAAYRILEFDEVLPLGELRRILVSTEGRETGWPPWVTIDNEESRPVPVDGTVESYLGRLKNLDPGGSDYWRADPNGKLYLLRGYQEDGDPAKTKPGSVFDVHLPIWRVAEVLRHSMRFAQAVSSDDMSLHIRFDWSGLRGRELQSWADPIKFLSRGRKSTQDSVISYSEYTSSEVRNNLAELVASITMPLFEVFDFFEASDELIRNELDELLRPR